MRKIKIPVEEAIGCILPHDITEVDLEKNFKGRVFKKGHVIKKEDIEKLKLLGKDYIYVLKLEEDEIHENEAAILLSQALSGENTYRDKEPSEGKINIYAKVDGIFVYDIEILKKFNMVGEPSCPAIFPYTFVKKGQKLASVRIISLACKKEEVEKAINLLPKEGLFKVIPFSPKKAGLIITGNEIYYGRKKDAFYDKLKNKLKNYKVEIVEKVILPDDKEQIKEKIKEFSKKYDLVLLTGGTSVDPDDVTYLALRELNPENYIRGNPIQPGNMLTFGYVNNTPVVCIPAAALYYKVTSFDIWLPKFLLKERITKEEVAAKSIGGLCFNCKICVYPICSFGKGY